MRYIKFYGKTFESLDVILNLGENWEYDCINDSGYVAWDKSATDSALINDLVKTGINRIMARVLVANFRAFQEWFEDDEADEKVFDSIRCMIDSILRAKY